MLRGILVAGVLVAASPAFAHHGTSITYRTTESITLDGVVTEFVYGYPHPQMYFDVTDEHGEVQHWGTEFGPTPLMMRRAGFKKDAIKAGDKIPLTCSPHKTPGTHACLLRKLIVNGTPLQIGGGGNQNNRADN